MAEQAAGENTYKKEILLAGILAAAAALLAVIVWAALQGRLWARQKVLADNWDSMCCADKVFFRGLLSVCPGAFWCGCG